MSNVKKTLLATALGLTALSGLPAVAAPIFGLDTVNDIEIVNRENVYRSAATCAALPGTCLPFDPARDPPGYLRPNPNIGNNIIPGDLFIGVLQIRNISNPVDADTWSQDNVGNPGDAIDTFTGYFVQEVKLVGLQPGSTNVARIVLGSATVNDPFGVLNIGGADGNLATLADNVMTGLWVDDGILGAGADSRMLLDPATVSASILSATDGQLFAFLGVGEDSAVGLNGLGEVVNLAVDTDGYIYSDAVIDSGLGNFSGSFQMALNILATGPGYNLGALSGLNDPVELAFGGALAGDPATTIANNLAGVCVPTATYACNDIVGNGQLSVNQTASPWQFASEDPLQLRPIPEPASLALLGLGLLGMAGVRRRRA